MSVENFSGTGNGTGRLDDEGEPRSASGNPLNKGPAGWDIEHGFLPGSTFLFDVGVNRGHGGDKGVGLEVDKYGGDGTKDEILTKKLERSPLAPEAGVDGEYGNFGIWTVFKIDETEPPHGRPVGKILEALEVEPGAHSNDVGCGFETDTADDCEAFDVGGEAKVDLSGVDVLPTFNAENAGDDNNWIIELKMSVLSVGTDGVGSINGIDPGEEVSGERVGVEEMAELIAWLDELELGLDEGSKGGDIVFEIGVRCVFEVESDVEGKHGWDEPCLWLRNEHEKAPSYNTPNKIFH